MKENFKFFKRTDILVIAAIVALSLFIWTFYKHMVYGKPVKAEIYYNSVLVKTVDLIPGQEKTFSIPQNENVVFHIDKDGKIQFIESDCPDKVCIKTGKLHLAGQSAACLPNGIILKIVPAGEWDENDPDIVVGGGG